MSLVYVLSLFLLLEVPKSCIANYDYFSFPQTWPKGYCDKQIAENKSIHCLGKIPKKFIIHGLWPQPSQQAPNGSQLAEEDIKAVEKELKLDWPNLIGRNFMFWKSEWKAHGVISEAQFPKLEYFKTALRIYKENNLLDILNKEKIVPKAKEVYSVSSVVAAVQKHTDHYPQLACYKDSKKNVSVLYEIRICLTSNANSYRNCPNPHGACGDGDLLFPK
ncbi:intracellular ribonuclease LX-like [Vigna radiata var. radiata]|uniref:Intracellular ribonuclease LX-like n=1 Tax=Vigna radiata var. radiata TaxID=3916 RepID=A0A3Q0FES2_VIGRR|nr:intracellular ribonuclease LX-like [Vigna radiata var. radiata]